VRLPLGIVKVTGFGSAGEIVRQVDGVVFLPVPNLHTEICSFPGWLPGSR